jgi:hypothetical protein
MTIRHFAAIAGSVTDRDTGKPVAGALVEIVSLPDAARDALPFTQPVRTTTGPDGHYHFLDLPDGSYELSVTAAGREETRMQAKVQRSPAKSTKPQIAMPAWCNAELKFKDATKSKGA